MPADHLEQVLDGLILAFFVYRVDGALHHDHRILRDQAGDLAAQRRKICAGVNGRSIILHGGGQKRKARRKDARSFLALYFQNSILKKEIVPYFAQAP